MRDLLITYDIGVSSIGWSVWRTVSIEPELLATGGVDFPTDDCLASKRRQLCHLRRTIRAKKHCIEQLGKLFVHLQLLSPDEVRTNRAKASDFSRHPWFLAARVLAVKTPAEKEQARLNWSELWDVLRWYAHNRGYYVPWAGSNDDSTEGTRKVEAAKALMEHHGKAWMAATFCAAFGIPDPFNPPASPRGKFVGQKFKGNRGLEIPSFPREDVLMPEVRQILEAHRTTLGADPAFSTYSYDKFISAIVARWEDIPEDLLLRTAIRVDRSRSKAQRTSDKQSKIWLPKRYSRDAGGLLFGQRIPRFDNRIISRCPVKKGQKTPLKQTREFYEYRWAMLVANIRVGESPEDFKPLSKKQRNDLDAEMRLRGFLTPKRLKEAVTETTGFESSNLQKMFVDTPEAEKALIVEPVDEYLSRESRLAHYLFPVLPEVLRRNLRNELWRGKAISVAKLRKRLGDDADALRKFEDALSAHIRHETEAAKKGDAQEPEDDDGLMVRDADDDGETEPEPIAGNRKRGKRSKRKPPTRDELLKSTLRVSSLSGRAPYCREILDQVKEEVFGKKKNGEDVAGAYDPRRYSKAQLQREGGATPARLEKAEDKPAHGCLAGVEEVSKKTLGILETKEDREAAYQQWRVDWIAERNSKSEELNRRRAEKYGEAWVFRQYTTRELEKWLAAKSNNHLVRQRMLILDRLTQDIIADPQLGNGDPNRVGQIGIEVARDLVTFSGLSSKQRGGDDGGIMGSIRAQHCRVKKKLEKDLKNTRWEHEVGKLLWKAKVADDLDWRCPYTGIQFCPCDLASGKMDVDHIIPKSVRLTNAMEAVVITFKAINELKAARTALGFINWVQANGGRPLGELWNAKCKNCDAQDRPVSPPDGSPLNAEILSKANFLKLVKGLKTGSAYDKENPKCLPGTDRKHPDFKRRERRKDYLQIAEYNKENDSFTSRQLTQTSYLNRLAQSVLLRRFPDLREVDVVSIPGQVTKAMRDSGGWSLFSCLGHRDVCGNAATRMVEYHDKDGNLIKKRRPEIKEELRKLTHLHHAVDACGLGLIAHWLPKNGKLWELLALRELNESEKNQYESMRDQFARGQLDGGERVKVRHLDDFLRCQLIDDAKARRSPDPDRKWRLEPRRDPEAKARMCRIRDQISRKLAERRVIQHIPAELDGLPTDETVYRVVTSRNGDGRIGKLVEDCINTQRRMATELKKAFEESDAKYQAIKDALKAIPDKEEQKREGSARKEEKQSLSKDREAKREAWTKAADKLATMEDFDKFVWKIKYVRRGSPRWNDIIKRLKGAAAKDSSGTPNGADGATIESEPEVTKAKKLPEFLVAPNPNTDNAFIERDIVPREKLIGVAPSIGSSGKLARLKAAKEMTDNYGVAFLQTKRDPKEQFVVIPRFKVWQRIHEDLFLDGGDSLVKRNGGKMPIFIRKGNIIEMDGDNGKRVRYRILGSGKKQDRGIYFDYALPDETKRRSDNLSPEKLVAANFRVLSTSLTGTVRPPCPTTSSA